MCETDSFICVGLSVFHSIKLISHYISSTKRLRMPNAGVKASAKLFASITESACSGNCSTGSWTTARHAQLIVLASADCQSPCSISAIRIGRSSCRRPQLSLTGTRRHHCRYTSGWTCSPRRRQDWGPWMWHRSRSRSCRCRPDSRRHSWWQRLSAGLFCGTAANRAEDSDLVGRSSWCFWRALTACRRHCWPLPCPPRRLFLQKRWVSVLLVKWLIDWFTCWFDKHRRMYNMPTTISTRIDATFLFLHIFLTDYEHSA